MNTDITGKMVLYNSYTPVIATEAGEPGITPDITCYITVIPERGKGKSPLWKPPYYPQDPTVKGNCWITNSIFQRFFFLWPRIIE